MGKDSNDGRSSSKITKKFHDYISDDVLKSTFPVKAMSQLLTLCTFSWLKKYNRASVDEKKEMIDDLKNCRDECEKKEYLKNSREVEEFTND